MGPFWEERDYQIDTSKKYILQSIAHELTFESIEECEQFIKDCIDFELLERYSEGIIGLSACLSGEISKAILRNDYDEAKEIAIKYNGLFVMGENGKPMILEYK